jgi:phosphoribosylformylglycinamidine synthase
LLISLLIKISFLVPVSDVAVVRNSLDPGSLESAQAMGMGEKPLISVSDPCASVRMALCEAILNLLAADVDNFSEIVVSANWMAAVKHKGQDKALANAVVALAEACKSCGIVIPVGKDSLSMETKWKRDERGFDEEVNKQVNKEFNKVVSPVTCVISAFAGCGVNGTLTPQLLPSSKSTKHVLVLVPLITTKNGTFSIIFQDQTLF